MATVIITYSLKAGVSDADYQTWIRDTDYPTMRGVKRVASYVNHHVTRRMMGEGPLPFTYMELFEITDLDVFLAEDMGTSAVQGILGHFMAHVENPDFLVAEAIA